MDRHDKKHHPPPRQSSLPSSLIPHLYSGPQQARYSQTRTTLRPEGLPHHDWSERSTSTQHSSIHPGPSSPLLLGQHRRHFPPFEFSPLETRDRHSERRLPELSSTPLHRASDPRSSFPQRHGSPIYSDPVFYSSSRPSMSSRNFGHTLPPLSTQREISLSQTHWREGEAGPSSLLRPVSQEDSPSRHRRGLSHPMHVDQRPFDSNRRGSSGYEQGTFMFDQSRHTNDSDVYRPTSGHSLLSNIHIHSIW